MSSKRNSYKFNNKNNNSHTLLSTNEANKNGTHFRSTNPSKIPIGEQRPMVDNARMRVCVGKAAPLPWSLWPMDHHHRLCLAFIYSNRLQSENAPLHSYVFGRDADPQLLLHSGRESACRRLFCVDHTYTQFLYANA